MGKISTLVLIAIYLALAPSSGDSAPGLFSQRAPLHLVRHGLASASPVPVVHVTPASSLLLVGGLR